MLQTFFTIVHILACLILMFVVLLQQGKGGGMGAAFGGATTQVFGGRGAGNILTRATAVCAATFMLTCIYLAHESSGDDRALRARIAQDSKKGDKGQKREKQDSPPPSGAAGTPSGTPAPSDAPPSPDAPKP